MSDSERPNPPPPNFEVPDLELEPVPRSLPRKPPIATSTLGANKPTSPAEQLFGVNFDFGDDLEHLEFEHTLQPKVDQPLEPSATRAVASPRVPSFVAEVEAGAPTGRVPDLTKLQIDPRELSILADYGEPPEGAAHTLAYAYRVFVRQRELKHQLAPVAAECERAELDREATLAELARTLRPAIEQIALFRPSLAQLWEIETRAAARGQALTSINAELAAQNAALDAELARVNAELETEQRTETEAQRRHDDCEANTRRIDAKLKRVQIETRAVTHVAEQKLGPQGGQVPDQEALQLEELQNRARALQPELAQARALFEQEKLALGQAQARMAVLRRAERQISRKRAALDEAYQNELSLRAEGVGKAELEQRAALADLARAALAAPGTIDVPEAWLRRVRDVDARANSLTLRREMLARAIASYDPARARQGVRLACTAAGLLLVLFAFKLIF